MGQIYLIGLCQSFVSNENSLQLTQFMEPLFDIIFAEDITSVESYKFLSELFLSKDRSEKAAFREYYKKQIDPDIIRGMLKSMGNDLVDWIENFFNLEVRNQFLMTRRHFLLDAFNNEQRQHFIDNIITFSNKISWRVSWLSLELESPLKLFKWIADVLGENVLKYILLRNDNSCLTIVHFLFSNRGVNIAYNALTCFTDESLKRHVRDVLEKEGPRVIKEKLFSQQQNEGNFIYGKWGFQLLELLLFYLKNSTIEQLETFVQDITAIIRKTNTEQLSIYGYAFYELCDTPGILRTDNTTAGEFMKLLSDKLGNDAVEQVVLHKDDEGNAIIARNYFKYKRIVRSMYGHLPKNKRDDIRHKLLTNVSDTGQIENWMKKEITYDEMNSTEWALDYLGIDDRGVATDLPDGFNVLSLYFVEQLDDYQLRQFVEFIVSVKTILTSEGNRRRYSIWTDYVDKACAAQDDIIVVKPSRSCQAIQKFLNCVSQKLGQEFVRQNLLFHENDRVFDCAASNGDFHIFGTLFNHPDVSREFRKEFIMSIARLEVIQGIWKNYKMKPLELLFGIDHEEMATNLLGEFQWLFYFLFEESFKMNDSKGFLDFVLDVKEIKGEGRPRRYSIWSDFIDKTCEERINNIFDIFEIFVRVKNELGDDQLKRLVNHDANGNGPAVLRILNEMSYHDKQRYLNMYPMLAEYLASEEHLNPALTM